MIVSEEMTAFAAKTLGLSPTTRIELNPFSERGSDRSYFRLKWNETQSALLMHYDPKRRENTYFVDIASFLGSIGIPVPCISGHDPDICYIVMQDLGDMDLWTLRNTSWENRRSLYQKTLAAIHRLHAHPADLFPADQISLAEAFGPNLYLWERNYFKENFIVQLCRIFPEQEFDQRLETELAAMARRLSELPRCLVHRDLQSQNVMIHNDEPFFIDFQGMRFGTLFYDLGSLLYDPYIPFSESEREELLFFYFRHSATEMDWDGFRKSFLEASVQRLMQALGAYAFLGITKGLQKYLKYINPGLQNLITAVRKAGTLPQLEELANRCSKE